MMKIWEALEAVHKGGRVRYPYCSTPDIIFDSVEEVAKNIQYIDGWAIVKEPKPKKKVKLYGFIDVEAVVHLIESNITPRGWIRIPGFDQEIEVDEKC